ncbi:hypothetical protein HanPI659440_Chr10g0371551 [Helianthus annuus]|nr:hypothetical protein HanPI659440_Chr10g0371551 [Helianthus annuus]
MPFNYGGVNFDPFTNSMAYGSGFGLLLSQTSQKRKMSYMGNELYLHLKTGNLQVGSKAPDMSMCFQHLRLTLTYLQR